VKELVSPRAGEIAWRAYTDRPITPHELRFRSLYSAAKHGTETGIVRRTDPTLARRYDTTLHVFRERADPIDDVPPIGNMTVGIVSEVGAAVDAFAVGDVVYGWFGVRETHTTTTERVWRVPAGVEPSATLCIDPADYALCGVRDGGLRLGDDAAVFGLGAIGLMAVQLLRIAGAREIVAVDPLGERRDLALALGATHAIDPTAEDAGLAIKERTHGGVDVAYEISGNHHALHAAVRAARFGGTIVTIGLLLGEAKGLDLGLEWHFNRQRIVASRSASEPNVDHPRWNRERLRGTILDLLRDGRLSTHGILGPFVPFEGALEAYREVLERPGSGIKLTITYDAARENA
jgi:threonine dehydrogenase-like Zn-dependent dehydrogenase